jgi:hypothetical protein
MQTNVFNVKSVITNVKEAKEARNSPIVASKP